MSENDVVVQAWNTVLFDKFLRFKHLIVAGLAAHSDEILGRDLYPKGARVLDVGCGFGDSTIKIANAVGSSGEAVGVDCAENFVHASEGEAKAASTA
ncbi:MAG: methyltransferase domain-containing protein, partial [Polyangiaceae bacterium]